MTKIIQPMPAAKLPDESIWKYEEETDRWLVADKPEFMPQPDLNCMDIKTGLHETKTEMTTEQFNQFADLIRASALCHMPVYIETLPNKNLIITVPMHAHDMILLLNCMSYQY